MKKIFVTVSCMAVFCEASYSVSYIKIEREKGEAVNYEVDDISQIYFEDPDTVKVVWPKVAVDGEFDGYSFVDLGLPSGTLWATYNVGATEPKEFGNYYAWGETEPKDFYWWETYKWCDYEEEERYTQLKYVISDKNGVVDSLMTRLPEDDAATVNWGDSWRMPTSEELYEFQNSCVWKWESRDGVGGKIGKSKYNGKRIFLPSAGYKEYSYIERGDGEARYWSSTRNDSDYGFTAKAFNFYDGRLVIYEDCCMHPSTHDVYIGNSVRAVVNK